MSHENSYQPRLAIFLLVGASISICFAGFATLGVTTILPSIAKDLHGEVMYPLANGMALAGQLVATAVAGAWCDSRGALKPLLTGLVTFVSGLAICALAPTMLIFITGRTLQGLGGGLLMVCMYVLVGAIVAPKKRPFFFGVFAGAWVVPALVGPYIAGVIDARLGWRTVFYILIPAIFLASLILFPLLRHVPRMRQALSLRAKRTIRAATVAFITLTLAQLGFTLPIRGGLIIAVVSLLVLVATVQGLFPEGTLRLRKGVPAMIASRGLINAGYVATETFIPLMLFQAHGWKPEHAALVISAGSITWAAGAVVQSKMQDPLLRRHLPTVGGILAAGGGVATAAAAFPIVSPYISVAGWAISAFGVGLSYPALSVLALDATPPEKHGYISSSLQLADSLGGAAALTIITSAFAFLAHLPAPGPLLPAMIFAIGLAALAAYSGKRIGALKVS